MDRFSSAILAGKSMVLLMLAALATMIGCGSGDGLDRRGVSGTITFDGAPLATGSIRFEPRGKGGLAGGASVVDGDYEIPAANGIPPGSYRVSISSAAESPTSAPSMENEGATPATERIPPRYNVESELGAEVPATGPAEFNFELTSR